MAHDEEARIALPSIKSQAETEKDSMETIPTTSKTVV